MFVLLRFHFRYFRPTHPLPFPWVTMSFTPMASSPLDYWEWISAFSEVKIHFSTWLSGHLHLNMSHGHFKLMFHTMFRISHLHFSQTSLFKYEHLPVLPVLKVPQFTLDQTETRDTSSLPYFLYLIMLLYCRLNLCLRCIPSYPLALL